MIPYEELVAALDRYVARRGGTPASVRPSATAAPSPPSQPMTTGDPATSQTSMPPLSYDEHRDPDMPRGQHDEDATHVGASPGAVHEGEDHPDEIDIGDVLTDDEL